MLVAADTTPTHARALATDGSNAKRNTINSAALAEDRAARVKPAARATHDIGRWLRHAPLALGLSMAVVLAGTALVHRTPHEVPAPVAEAAAPTHISPSAPAPKPVLFVNPFDETEVFEFPPGTTEADARDAVASLLLARARERQKNAVNVIRRGRKNS